MNADENENSKGANVKTFDIRKIYSMTFIGEHLYYCGSYAVLDDNPEFYAIIVTNAVSYFFSAASPESPRILVETFKDMIDDMYQAVFYRRLPRSGLNRFRLL